MSHPNDLRRWVPALGLWLTALVVGAGPCRPTRAESPPPALEERLKRLEEVNTRLLDRLDRDRKESDRRYRELEGRYKELQRRVGEIRPEGKPGTGTEAKDSAESTESRPGSEAGTDDPRGASERSGS